MSQIVTVSPVTAAYAAQAGKPVARTTTLFEQKIEAWRDAARIDGDERVKAYLTLVKPPALALALLTTKRQPDISAAEAERIYAEIAGQSLADPDATPTAED